MLSHVGIDSLSIARSTLQHFDFGGGPEDQKRIDLNCFFRDPYEKNYYRIKVFEDDTTRSDNYRLYDDQYTNGQEIGLRVAHVNAGHRYLVQLFSLDKPTFGYYRTLEELIHTNPVFGSTPANPNSNLTNGALGYFGACAVSAQTITVTDSMYDAIK